MSVLSKIKNAKPKTVAAAKTAAKSTKKGEVVSEPVDDEAEASTEIVTIAKGAYQLALGGQILDDVFADFETGDTIKELTGKRGYLKQRARANAVLALTRILEADESIDATSVYATDAVWKKTLAQIYLALGIKDEHGAYTPRALEKFPNPKASDEEKETHEYKLRKQVRDNFATTLKRSIRAAKAIIDKDMQPVFNDTLGTLRLLNAPSTIAGKGKHEVDLVGGKKKEPGAKDTASFESLMAIADRTYDKEGKMSKGKGQQGAAATATVDDIAHDAATSLKDLTALCAAVITTVNNMDGKVKGEQRKVLQNLYDKLEAFLTSAQDVE